MTLPPTDLEFLVEREIHYQAHVDGNVTCLVFPAWRVPFGYEQQGTDVLVRLMPGYPDVPPDMWWLSPALTVPGGAPIPGTDLTEVHLGRSWQRWSRHFQPGQWRTGIDGLESFLALIGAELERCAGAVV